MGHIVLDLTSLAYQPTTKSRERSGHPRRHVTFAMSERKPAYPALTQDMHGDEDDGPLAPDLMVVYDDEDDQPLVQPASRKKRRKSMIQLLMTETVHPWFLQDHLQLHQCEEEKDRQYGKTQLPHWNKRIQGTRVSEQRMPRFWQKGRR